MNVTALDNLNILTEQKSKTHSLIADGNVLSLIEKDSFDPILKLQSLEYPIFFTYHHIFNILTHDTSISYYQKKYLLEKIEESLENLVNFIHDYEEENQLLVEIISGIEDKFDIVRENTIYKKCESMIHLFDDLVDACRLAGKCLYFSPRPYDILYDLEPGKFYESLDSDENESDSDDSDDSNDEYEEFDEENFNDIEFEGVTYSEDNRFDKIYNQAKKFVGIWNDNRDDIMWIDDEYRVEHETSKVKLD